MMKTGLMTPLRFIGARSAIRLKMKRTIWHRRTFFQATFAMNEFICLDRAVI